MKKSTVIKAMVDETMDELFGGDMTHPDFPYKVATAMLDVCQRHGMKLVCEELETGRLFEMSWEIENEEK